MREVAMAAIHSKRVWGGAILATVIAAWLYKD
jgi:hypothetical protein